MEEMRVTHILAILAAFLQPTECQTCPTTYGTNACGSSAWGLGDKAMVLAMDLGVPGITAPCCLIIDYIEFQSVETNKGIDVLAFTKGVGGYTVTDRQSYTVASTGLQRIPASGTMNLTIASGRYLGFNWPDRVNVGRDSGTCASAIRVIEGKTGGPPTAIGQTFSPSTSIPTDALNLKVYAAVHTATFTNLPATIVASSTVVNAVLYTVALSDPHISFEIISSTPSSAFTVDITTGQVSAASSVGVGTYALVIQANYTICNAVSVISETLTITVNTAINTAPVLVSVLPVKTLGYYNVTAGLITSIPVTDTDPGANLSCIITSMQPTGPYTIPARSTSLQTTSHSGFTAKNYSLKIECTDGYESVNTSLYINITQNIPPVVTISPATYNVNELDRTSYTLASVTTTDAGPVATPFHCSETCTPNCFTNFQTTALPSGNIQTVAGHSGFSASVYNYTVQCNDSFDSAADSLVIYINPNLPPELSRWPANNNLTISAATVNGGSGAFFLGGPSDPDHFLAYSCNYTFTPNTTLFTQTGIGGCDLQATGSLLNETLLLYTVEASITDGADYTHGYSMHLNIDCVFRWRNLPATIPSATTILNGAHYTVNTSDPVTRFDVLSSSPPSAFNIYPITGVILATNSVAINTYTLTVQASYTLCGLADTKINYLTIIVNETINNTVTTNSTTLTESSGDVELAVGLTLLLVGVATTATTIYLAVKKCEPLRCLFGRRCRGKSQNTERAEEEEDVTSSTRENSPGPSSTRGHSPGPSSTKGHSPGPKQNL